MGKLPKYFISVSALLVLAGILAVLIFVQFPATLLALKKGSGDAIGSGRGAGEAREESGEEKKEIKAVEEELPEKISLLFAGDIMLDRNVYLKVRAKDDYDFPFEKIGSVIESADFFVANLEGPVTDNKSVSLEKDRMVFTFSPEFLPVLKKYFNAFSLANNHTQNFGQKGLIVSRDYLSKSAIGYFGDPNNDEKNLSAVFEKNGFKIGFVGYHGLYRDEPEKVSKEIEKLRPDCDLIIIFPHWGIEYKRKPSASQEKEARLFIDSGADLVIGSHPHVIQTVEEYKGKLIFYSLGNFIFDQYFSKETMEGLTVGVDVFKLDGKLKIDYRIIPITISKESQAELAGEERKKEILDWLAENSGVSEKIREEIKSGFF